MCFTIKEHELPHSGVFLNSGSSSKDRNLGNLIKKKVIFLKKKSLVAIIL